MKVGQLRRQNFQGSTGKPASFRVKYQARSEISSLAMARIIWSSSTAEFAGFRPLIGQPLGMIHRLVCRVVTRRISGAPDFVKR
jgi:hypothetical protein